MKMTQREDVWDRRTRWRNKYNKAPNIQDRFHKLEVSSPSVPCLETTGEKSSWGTLTNKGKDLNNKQRKTLMPIPKMNSGRILAKSNSLPPIYSQKTCMPNLRIEYPEQKMEKKCNILRIDRVLFDRQKQGCQLTLTSQLIDSRKGVFIEKEPDLRQDNLKTLVTFQNLFVDEKSRVSKGRCATPMSDSAIEMDSLSSPKKENEEEKDELRDDKEEEEYYTDQRITAWIVKVNASLFSTSKITDHSLEEQDVDTIKFIYGED